MTFKNLLKFSTIVFLFTIVLGSVSFGQTTYYVDVQNGLDGYNGLQPTPGGPGIGPKQTITNAIAAASDGDIISVAYANGNLYNENVNYLVLAAGPNKRLTFTSTGGAPNVVSFTLNSNNAWAPNNYVTFTGPFTLTTGLTLTDGDIIGASNLTVGGAVSRNTAAPAAGTVDSQLNFTGVVNFTYTGGSNVTTGGELPAAGNTTNFGDLTTAAGTVTLSSSKTMNGLLTTGGVLAIGSGNTLTIQGTSTPHVIGGNVTGGTLAFTLGATPINVNGNFNLPAVTVTASAARTLNLNTNTTIGNVTAGGSATVNIPNAITVGALTNNSSGAITPAAATTIASITNTSSGNVVVTTAAAYNVTGNVAQSGSGFINFNGGAPTIGGSVSNNPAQTITDAAVTNKGYIAFTPNVAVVITGQLTVGSTFTGTTGATGATNWTNNGDVRFLGTTADVTITGGVSIGTSHTITYGGTAIVAISGNGGVSFASTTGNIFIPGGVTISTTWPAINAGAPSINNGSLTAAARTTGLFGGTGGGQTRVGAINVTSTGTNGANGNFQPGTGGGFAGTSVSTSGGAGGYIQFGNEFVNLSGSVTNSRTSANNHLDFGNAATAALNVQIGGNLTNSGSSNIRFLYFNGGAGNETFTVTGTVSVSGGAVSVNPLSPLNGTGQFSFGGLNISGGTLDLTGAVTSNMDVIVNGNASFTGGTLDCVGAGALTTNFTVTPVVVVAGDRVLQLGGLTDTFSTATGNTTFTTTNTLMLIQPTTIVAAQTVTGNLTQTVWPGVILVKNPTGLTPAVTFNGGNIRALGGFTFDLSQVRVDNVTLFIGGQLAPNVGTGNFYNHSGYTTNGQGFVSMNNNAAGGTFGGGGEFQNFETDCAVSVTAAAGLGNFTAIYNLTNGAVLTSNNINFNNTTNYPTIVRNAGTFAVAPTFTSMVNVIYIGLDKTTSLELPAAANKLNNLTVATTNDGTPPLIAGRGAVQCGVATTVNGTLTIYDGQALVINAVNLTMNGAAINLNTSGIITNDAAGSTLVFNRAAGTTVSGSGWLPDITVAAGSSGNVINGAHGLVTAFLSNVDFSFGGAGGSADFDPTASAASGSITFGAGTAGLQVMFGTGALNGTNLANITTADAGNTLQISGNMTEGGNIAHTAGTISIDGGFTWTYRGLAPAVTSGAAITGPGSLAFRVGATLFSAVGGNVTIAAPLTINLGAAGTTFTIDPANAGGLILTGDFTFTQGTMVLGNGVTARNLTVRGSNFTMTGNSSFQVVDVPAGPVAAFIQGTLVLNATTAPLTWTYSGNVTLGKVTVTNDVVLAGTGAGSITIQNTFTHNGGNLNFSNRNITIDGLTDLDPGVPVWAAGGTFNRTAATATYSATTGYLIIRTAAFNQGTGFSIPNLRFGVNSDAVSPTFGNPQNATVTNNLYVDVATGQTITHTVGGSARLNVSDGATVTYQDGAFDVAPVYAGTIKLTVVNTGVRTINATVWPNTATLVSTLNINNTAAANLPGGRQVNTQLTLTAGNLNLAAAAQVLTLVDNLAVQVVAGTLTTAGGSVVYGNNMNYTYAVNAAYGTNAELTPATTPINNLTFTRTNNVVNAAVTINKSITVNGTLTIKNDVTIPAAPPTIVATVNGDVTIVNDAANFSNATNPVLTFAQSLVFGGANNATITVPAATPALNIGAITINKTNNTNTVTISGGNLATGTITFVNGLIVTGSNILFVPAPTTGAVALGAVSQGFTRAGVTGNNISHVVGNVGKALINNGGINGSTEARSVFPVGTNTVYRPAAITFNPAFGVPTNPNVTIVVNHVDANPNGAVGLPITDGVATGIDVARYPSFYWYIYTTPGSVGPSTPFDLELTGGNFTDFDAPANVRIIRRHGAVGDINNAWLLQGANNAYDNEVNSVTGFTSINRGANAGLRSGGAAFTFGLKSNMKINPASGLVKYLNTYKKIWLVQPDGMKGYSIADLFTGNIGSLTYVAQSSNESVVTVNQPGSGTTLQLTPVATGDAVITVIAQDLTYNDFFAYSFNVNVNPTDVESTDQLPTEFALFQNYPNPFNPTTNIKFDLPKESNVTLKVYNILGEEVATLVNKVMPAGHQVVTFDASRLASGMYIYRIEAGNFVQVKKMLLMK